MYGRVVMRSAWSTVERRFESYSGSLFFGDENWVCCGCGAGSSLRPSLFNPTCMCCAIYMYGCLQCVKLSISSIYKSALKGEKISVNLPQDDQPVYSLPSDPNKCNTYSDGHPKVHVYMVWVIEYEITVTSRNMTNEQCLWKILG